MGVNGGNDMNGIAWAEDLKWEKGVGPSPEDCRHELEKELRKRLISWHEIQGK